MSALPSDSCSCRWTRYGPIPMMRRMVSRDLSCPRHGNGSRWWAEQERIAEALHATIATEGS